MIIFLILGAILGALLVIFVLQNVAVVTVTFLTWHITGSLALVLLASIISGVVITLLVLLPGLIRDDFRLSGIKRQLRETQDQLEKTKAALMEARTAQAVATRMAVEPPPPHY
jgi:uncharacterized integral membrane protein